MTFKKKVEMEFYKHTQPHVIIIPLDAADDKA